MYNVTIRFRPETKADEKRYYNVKDPIIRPEFDSLTVCTDLPPKKVAVFHWSDILEVLTEEVE